MKKMIFHIPLEVDKNRKSASHLRPTKMIEAFKKIGYEVYEVSGPARERKIAIDNIKKLINQGEKFDFCYSESSTMPTLLTEKHHLPNHPFLDFGFFKFLKKHSIKIGLFYRDIHWKFPIYGQGLSKIKKNFAIAMYKHDQREYEKYLDIVYLPDDKVAKYIPEALRKRSISLPPGAVLKEEGEKSSFDKLRLFYVGGLSELYDIRTFVEAVSKSPEIDLTISTRQGEWEAEKEKYEDFITDNIHIVHLSGEDLTVALVKSDMGVFPLKPSPYIEMAMPYKLFEYLGHGLPIIAIKNTAAGNFVEKNKIGQTCNYNVKDFLNLFKELHDNKNKIDEFRDNITKIAHKHTWEARADQVAKELSR